MKVPDEVKRMVKEAYKRSDNRGKLQMLKPKIVREIGEKYNVYNSNNDELIEMLKNRCTNSDLKYVWSKICFSTVNTFKKKYENVDNGIKMMDMCF